MSPHHLKPIRWFRTQAKSIQDPPKISDQVRNIDFRKLGKQIASLSPILVGGGAGDILLSDTQQASAQFASLITQIATMKANSQISALDPLVESTEQVSQAEVDQLVERALSRSQVFLNNDRARAVLGSESLQVFVYASDIRQEGNHLAAFYMDADKGQNSQMQIWPRAIIKNHTSIHSSLNKGQEI